MGFTPKITIGESKINPGQMVWTWHLPGMQTEVYGSVEAMPFDVTRREYVRRLNRNPHSKFQESDVQRPEVSVKDEAPRFPEESNVVHSEECPSLCGCGAPFSHRGMCKHRREKYAEREGKPFPQSRRGKSKVAEQAPAEIPLSPVLIPNGSHGATIDLGDGQTITLTVSGDAFALSKADREFVFGLLDTMREYPRKTS